MDLLEKLGLARKKRPAIPVVGDKKKKEQERFSLKRSPYIKALIFVGFLGLLMSIIPHFTVKDTTNYTIGEPWRQEDLTAPFTFALQKSEQELKQERQEVQQRIPPIFHIDHQAQQNVDSRIDSLFKRMQPVLNAYAGWKLNRTQNDNAVNDSLQFVNSLQQTGLGLTQSTLQPLLNNYVRVQKSKQNNNGTTNGWLGNDIKSELKDLCHDLLSNGIINVNEDELKMDEITVRDTRDRTERTLNVKNVRDLQEARDYARYHLSRVFFDDAAQAAMSIFNQVIQPNWIFNAEATQGRIDDALASISETKGAVAKGQVIIRRGDIITKEKYNMLRSLAEARAQNASQHEIYMRYLGDVLAIIAIVVVFFMYLFLYRRQIYEDNAMFLLVFLAMSIITIASSLVYQWDDISIYVVPVAIAPIILTIIFDSRVGLLATITLALLTGLINGNDFEYVVATTTACSLGVFSVRDIKDRSQFFFTTPGIVFLAYGVVLTGFSLTSFVGWDQLLDQLFFVAINAVFILFTYPLILLFEKLFKITTDFTLLELSDTNLPLLKQLMNKAPGTFHHSLQVANLTEAAAAAIGANALLCRVGALYHDIGKMEKPGYFTENQGGANEHDKLKPRMSALVIKAHVADGVKMARDHGLPEKIIDFIRTHHGTTLIKFFYERAKDQAENEQEIQEEDFRYDGPLPNSKETGILLLADCVEAASRAMKEPTYQKLDNLINRLFEERISEGQLNDCPLTFRQLRIIKDTFMNILVGIYHSRVEYPDDKKEKEKGEEKQQEEKQQEEKKAEEKKKSDKAGRPHAAPPNISSDGDDEKVSESNGGGMPGTINS